MLIKNNFKLNIKKQKYKTNFKVNPKKPKQKETKKDAEASFFKIMYSHPKPKQPSKLQPIESQPSESAPE